SARTTPPSPAAARLADDADGHPRTTPEPDPEVASSKPKSGSRRPQIDSTTPLASCLLWPPPGRPSPSIPPTIPVASRSSFDLLMLDQYGRGLHTIRWSSFWGPLQSRQDFATGPIGSASRTSCRACQIKIRLAG